MLTSGNPVLMLFPQTNPDFKIWMSGILHISLVLKEPNGNAWIFYWATYNKFPPLIFCSSEHIKISKIQLWIEGGRRKDCWFLSLITEYYLHILQDILKYLTERSKQQSSLKGNNMLDLNSLRDKINLKS